MAKKIYVGNLGTSIDGGALRALFAPYGGVQSATIAMDHSSGRSKGFGFVEMATDEETRNAISGLSGRAHAGRALIVNEARPTEKRRDSTPHKPVSKHGGTGRDNPAGGPRRMFI